MYRFHFVKILAIIAAVACASLAFGAQSVGGISIDYPPPLRPNPQKAEAWRAKLPSEVQGMIRSFQIYEAQGSSGIDEVGLATFEYTPKMRGNLDSAASESIANIVRLPGMKNPTQKTTRAVVSGMDARFISFEAERYDGKLGGEFLVIYDSTIRKFYQLQVIFSKRKGLNPLADLNLDAERLVASRIVKSVQVVKAQ